MMRSPAVVVGHGPLHHGDALPGVVLSLLLKPLLVPLLLIGNLFPLLLALVDAGPRDRGPQGTSRTLRCS